MGLQDRKWYAEDRKRRDAMNVKTGASGWNTSPTSLDMKQNLFWMSVTLNVILAGSLAYVLMR
ncbi:hypothetical protein [Marinobacterium stanieri]|uniref:Uncharacterized protein n=1 Tax=Marinobacterium stanieri TaxID=49186 RepID=A0A1N6R7F2_9GAMM|nr:hypothetical protein [Marinobacterium stanieri]SIQ24795.1 hypothetical protein SAMN05421647_103156 [Marinobacterium stanieri]